MVAWLYAEPGQRGSGCQDCGDQALRISGQHLTILRSSLLQAAKGAMRGAKRAIVPCRGVMSAVIPPVCHAASLSYGYILWHVHVIASIHTIVHRTIVPSYHRAIVPSHHHAIVLSYHRTILLSYHGAIVPSLPSYHCSISRYPCYHTIIEVTFHHTIV